MSAKENTFFSYKNKPLVRSGNVLYYGDMNYSHVVKMTIKSTHTQGDMEIADKVAIQLLSTDPDVSPRKAIVKSSEKPSLFLALDIGDVWLSKALKGSEKNTTA